MTNSRAYQEAIQTVQRTEPTAVIAFMEWAEGHTDEYVHVRPFEPDNDPDQRLTVTKIEAQPNLELARSLGRMGMGAANYDALVKELRNGGALEAVLANADQGLSTLIATVHLRNILDTAITHNALFVASASEGFANHNVIVSNQMVKFLSLGGFAVSKIVSLAGENILGTPADGARSHKIPEDAIRSINRLASPAIAEALDRGVAFHRAMTDTRAQKVILADGQTGRVVPPASVTASKRLKTAIGVAVDVSFGNGRAKVLEPRPVQTDEDIEGLMRDLVGATAEITDEPVFYGLPAGAQLL